ncbi:ATP-binding cassette domain-containing protein [Thiomicrorhabdus sediminis]|nr:ATP-binding cassette domain-containing protein [Thiomicrorhabdus sediminis]
MTLPQTKQIAIECRKLCYSINNQPLLNDVDCAFSAGAIHVLLGKNGAGKTTLLHLLAKEIKPSRGEVFWREKLLAEYSFTDLATQRAVLPQRQVLAFSISVQQLIALGVEAGQHFRNNEQKRLIIHQLLMLCDLDELADRDMLSLSGGEQQRAQIARVLAQIWPVPASVDFKKTAQKILQPLHFDGRWLLLDEWTTGLDLQHQVHFVTLFKQLAAQGLGIIMSVHDINLAWQLADFAYLLDNGALVASGEKTEVMSKPNLQQLFAIELNEVDTEKGKLFFCG